MERVKPDYLNAVPKDKAGFPWLAVISVALLAAMIGGAVIYARTVDAWQRARNPKPELAQQRSQHSSFAEPSAPINRPAEAIAAEKRLRQLYMDRQISHAGWKCISGTAFRPLPGGGWENVPGIRC